MANNSSRRRFTPTQWIIVILILALAWFVFTRITPQNTAPGSEAAAPAQPTTAVDAPPAASADAPADESDDAAAAPTAAAALCNTAQVSDLPAIAYDDLPPEAHATIARIQTDGPFPYDKDGSTFQNREGILPAEERGYYREYTVVTPGEGDRGARRIVGGEVEELYYTDDHYASFREVLCP
jgi:ribonuclease T1